MTILFHLQSIPSLGRTPQPGTGRKHIRRCSPLLISLVVLQACSTVSNYVRPEVTVPEVFKTSQGEARTDAAGAATDAWWQVFGDPALNQLQMSLLVNNQNLKNSLAQYQLARASLGASRAFQSPTLGVAAAANRNGTGGASTSNAGSIAANASWELDLWGRLAGGVEVSQAKLQASQDDVAVMRLSLQGTLTQTYFALRTADAQTAVLNKALATYLRALDLTQNRYAAGVTSSADVAQAESQFKSTQAQLIEARSSRAQLEHALAVLVGQAPSGFTLSEGSDLPVAPTVPSLLPSNLLARRPDIAAAERRVAAAYAQQGVARAAFFPGVTLSANAGYRGSAISDLISAPNLFWSIGPTLAASLLDGGARQAATDSAIASSDQALATYRQTVLVALQEVEDNLQASQSLDEEHTALNDSLVAARKALDVVTNQYQAGTVSFLNVLAAQSTALGVERSLLDVRYRKLLASSQLLKNLGGRWEPVAP
jgi:NodT family efflux transporter outer membrane factor (OMF) lipoprotein